MTGHPIIGTAIVAVLLAASAAPRSVHACCFCRDCGSEFCTDLPPDSGQCAALCSGAGCPSFVFQTAETCANNCGVPTPTPTPNPRAAKCQGAKLKVAGKYEYCRLKEAAKAAASGRAPDYARCDIRFTSAWAAAEAGGAGACPSNGDAAAVQAHIAQHTDGLDAAIAGGSLPPCP